MLGPLGMALLHRVLLVTPQGPVLEPSQQNGEETPEDVLERLGHMERLVAQLKDLVREKDAQLQQKDALLQVPFLCGRHHCSTLP